MKHLRLLLVTPIFLMLSGMRGIYFPSFTFNLFSVSLLIYFFSVSLYLNKLLQAEYCWFLLIHPEQQLLELYCACNWLQPPHLPIGFYLSHWSFLLFYSFPAFFWSIYFALIPFYVHYMQCKELRAMCFIVCFPSVLFNSFPAYFTVSKYVFFL